MQSPRKYYSALTFKDDPNPIIDVRPTNEWKVHGTCDFTHQSQFRDLKNFTCFTYTLNSEGYIDSPNLETSDTGEYCLSFWFKAEKEIFNVYYQLNLMKAAPLISWDNGYITAYDVLNGLIPETSTYAITIQDNDDYIQLPYPLEDHMGEWIHFMMNKDGNGYTRVFINGIKYLETPKFDFGGNFDNVKIGNTDTAGISYPSDIDISIDEIVFCNSCMTLDHFFPYPKYLHGFYPPVEIKEVNTRNLPCGHTRYDNVNDAVLITRPIYYRPPLGWEDDMITKYRFDREEPFATSYFDKWMGNRTRPGHEYKKK